MPEAAFAHGLVVLAAGASTRLGRSKQLLTLDGEVLVHRTARVALATAPRDAVIVLGNGAASVHAEVRQLPLRRVDCREWRDGMNASLRAGLAALSAECAGALVVLCDQPWLDVQHLQALCATWRLAPHGAAASFYQGRLGAPALLPRGWFAQLASVGDRGARDLLEARRGEVGRVANEALAIDIDEPADLAALERNGPARE
ncbi:MAG: nucleotidyltransferase family protein [Rudaea sp.]